LDELLFISSSSNFNRISSPTLLRVEFFFGCGGLAVNWIFRTLLLHFTQKDYSS